MSELDELLRGYLDRHYKSASDREKSAFRDLLTLSNPELIDYLLGGQEPADPETAHVAGQIRKRT